jgi:hypothetical protein
MPISGEDTMNWRKLPKEKRQHLVLIVVVTLGALAGLGWGLIKGQYDYLGRMAEKKVATQKKLERVEQAVKHVKEIEEDLNQNRKVLQESERDLAEGDLYSWLINTLRKFKTNYKVEIPQMSGIVGPSDVTLLPNFPYKQASITVMGTAHYHDLGRFIADLENQFPHVRLLNLSVELMPPSPNAEAETLTFKIEIVTLVKSNAS